MNTHKNARLTPNGRAHLARLFAPRPPEKWIERLQARAERLTDRSTRARRYITCQPRQVQIARPNKAKSAVNLCGFFQACIVMPLF